MHARPWIFAVTLCLSFGSLGLAQTPAPATLDAARIDALIAKLGSSAFVQRQTAQKELEAIGTPALKALRRASKKSSDLETTSRIDALIRRFEEQILTQQILTPKDVHLKLKDATVDQAIQELAKLSGYPIQIQGDRTPFADKKITLDTGKTSYWQACDRLCDEAGLMERIDLSALTRPQAPQLMPMRGKGIRRVTQIYPSYLPPAGPIVLISRGPEKSVFSYAGAVKTELRVNRDPGTKELILLFIVSAEPRLQNAAVAGKPLLERLLDQTSRKLAEAIDVPKLAGNKDNEEGMEQAIEFTPPQHRFTRIRVKEGPDSVKQLKEVIGKLTLQLDLQNETLAKVEKVLDAAGKSVTGVNGGTMKLNSIRKLDNGDIEAQVALDNLSQSPLGNNIIVNGGNVIIRGNIQGNVVIGPGGVLVNGSGNRNGLPDLFDAKGQKYEFAGITSESTNITNGVVSRTATIVYHSTAEKAEPRELILMGTRTHSIDVPFRFEKMPLP